jgi:WD40 repeat protein
LVGELVSGLVRYGLSAHGIVFSPDGEMLAIPAENQKIELWDVASQQQFGQLESATPPFGFTPDGKYLVASGNTVYPPPINFWDVQPHQLVGSLQGEGDTVASLALSLDGRWLAVGDSVGTIDLWQLNLSLGLVAVEPKGKQFIMLGEIKRTCLLQNYPNPFNPETWIPFILAEAADVEIAIYDINGQLVRWLMLGHREAGVYQNRNQAAYWDGRNNVGESVSSGGYFIELRTGEETFVRKAMLLK